VKLAELGHGRTLVCGFGREGRSLERSVLARGLDVDVAVLCDRSPDLPPSRWSLDVGPLRDDWPRPDRVLRSPGFPVDHPVLQAWRRCGTEVTCISSLWFGERPDARVIAVTGSKGKSTTAALIAHGLRACGLDAALAGNIGVPVLDLLDARPDWFVLELSSYQLADLRGHARIGVMTRLFPEHQDWHGGVESYYAAKLRLLELLDGGPLWINGADAVLAGRLEGHLRVRSINAGDDGMHVRGDGVWNGDRRVLAAEDSPLPGRHNLDNIALALAVVEAVAGDFGPALAQLGMFRGLPHRLERIEDAGGETWVNDSISTTPYATLAALQSDPGPAILICGGQERGADWSGVAEYLRSRPLLGLIGLPDNGERVVSELVAAGAVDPARQRVATTVEHAVQLAAEWRDRGVRVVLSPGAPSFPRFRDFEERGERFRQAVAALTGRG
jgi:UDP-N-acetylmuramoylalanine--D-glutamate ligase